MKNLCAILFFSSWIWAQNIEIKRILKDLISPRQYNKYGKIINNIFRNKHSYLTDGQLDYVKVLSKLKEFGIINPIFKKPTVFIYHFFSNAKPLVVNKLIDEEMISMGFFNYKTVKTTRKGDALHLSIKVKGEYLLDLVLLAKDLKKQNINIEKITVEGNTYTCILDTKSASINAPVVGLEAKVFEDTDSNYFFRLGSSGIIYIKSRSSLWHPKLFFYDENLQLLGLYRQQTKTKSISFQIPLLAVYIKISDMFSKVNIRKGFKIKTQTSSF